MAPILVIMVRKDEATQKMLDDSSECEKDMHNIKKRLSLLMHCDGDMLTEYKRIFDENGPSPSMGEIMQKIGNPLKRLHEMFQYI